MRQTFADGVLPARRRNRIDPFFEQEASMSFKDLGKKSTPQPHVETPEEAALREKAAAHHRAKEEKRAARVAGKPPEDPSKGDPTRR
jgi:hypothetical protein